MSPEPQRRRGALRAGALRFPSRARVARAGSRRSSPDSSCIGFSIALSVRAELGLAPWDVFHQGIAEATGLSIGVVVVLVGFVVLLAWIPLRQHLGLGTIVNTLSVGLIAEPRARADPRAAPCSRSASRSSSVAIVGVRDRRRPLHRLPASARATRRPDDRDHGARATGSGSCARSSSAACSSSASRSAARSAIGTVLIAFAIGPFDARRAPALPSARARRHARGHGGVKVAVDRHRLRRGGRRARVRRRPTAARSSTSCRPATTTRSGARSRALDVDLVSVHSPPFLHAPHVRAALGSGQGRAVRQAVRAGRRRGARARRRSRARRARSRCATSSSASTRCAACCASSSATDTLGAVEHVQWTHLSAGSRVPMRRYGWLFDRARGGGWIGAWASHAVDTIRWCFGEVVGRRRRGRASTSPSAPTSDGEHAGVHRRGRSHRDRSRSTTGVTVSIDSTFAASATVAAAHHRCSAPTRCARCSPTSGS